MKGFHRLIELWHRRPRQPRNRRRGSRTTPPAPTRRRPPEWCWRAFEPDVRNLMQAADLLVISSVPARPSTSAWPEALRERLPVVSTRVCGPEEILPPEQLADAGSLEATIPPLPSRPRRHTWANGSRFRLGRTNAHRRAHGGRDPSRVCRGVSGMKNLNVLVVSDGLPGHLNQSRGLACWARHALRRGDPGTGSAPAECGRWHAASYRRW